jgi:hypothetical protein
MKILRSVAGYTKKDQMTHILIQEIKFTIRITMEILCRMSGRQPDSKENSNSLSKRR